MKRHTTASTVLIWCISSSNCKKYSQDLEPVHDDINVFPDPVRGTRKYYRFVMYLVPTFSNPGGLNYTLETRQKLVEIARKYDLLLISDDVYEFLDYTDSKPLPRLNQLDKAGATKYGNTISNATFSKIIAPGLRVGWQETAAPKLVDQLSITGSNRSGGTPNQLSTLVVADLIKTGTIDEIITKFKNVYKERVAVLKRVLPSTCHKTQYMAVTEDTLFGSSHRQQTVSM